MTADEVAELVRKKTVTVVRWARTGKVRAVKSPGGRGWLFHPDDVAELMAATQNEIGPVGAANTEQAL
jgi:excisionase family DNA binding protein